jgi:hypothetical protein
MRWLELGILAEIVDRSGIVRKTAGCSILGRREFAARLADIQEILGGEQDSGKPWYDLYQDAGKFQHLIDRCLDLNSLEADWFTPAQIEALLLPHINPAGEPQQGHLVLLNAGSVSSPAQAQPEGPPQTTAEMIACLGSDLEQAMMLATEVPANLAIAINQAQAKLNRSPEEQEAAEKAERMAELKKMDIGELLKNG